MEDLLTYRDEIDILDKELVKIFEKRMEVSKKIALFKKNNNIYTLNKKREEEVIEKCKSLLTNNEIEGFLEEFYKNLMEISKKYQEEIIKKNELEENEEINVVFQGVLGSYSSIALNEFFHGKIHNKINVRNFEDVFKSLEDENINYGVLPIENSSTGGISEVYDLLRKENFYIVGERKIKVEHYLLGLEGASLEDIEEVYSHPQALLQCQEFLEKFPNWKVTPYTNTAASVKLIKEKGDKTKAAIGSIEAKDIYDLQILSPNINYNKNNFTRFIIIGKELNKDGDKISLVVSTAHKTGALYNILKIFWKNNINMVKIESRPILDKPWEYFFYIDFEGNINQEIIKSSIEEIKKESNYLKILGNYLSDIRR